MNRGVSHIESNKLSHPRNAIKHISKLGREASPEAFHVEWRNASGSTEVYLHSIPRLCSWLVFPLSYSCNWCFDVLTSLNKAESIDVSPFREFPAKMDSMAAPSVNVNCSRSLLLPVSQAPLEDTFSATALLAESSLASGFTNLRRLEIIYGWDPHRARPRLEDALTQSFSDITRGHRSLWVLYHNIVLYQADCFDWVIHKTILRNSSHSLL